MCIGGKCGLDGKMSIMYICTYHQRLILIICHFFFQTHACLHLCYLFDLSDQSSDDYCQGQMWIITNQYYPIYCMYNCCIFYIIIMLKHLKTSKMLYFIMTLWTFFLNSNAWISFHHFLTLRRLKIKWSNNIFLDKGGSKLVYWKVT